jgi:hypothetical protein
MLDDAGGECCIAPCVPAAAVAAAPLLACVGIGVCLGFALHLALPCVIWGVAGALTPVGVHNACGLRARRYVLETACAETDTDDTQRISAAVCE